MKHRLRDATIIFVVLGCGAVFGRAQVTFERLLNAAKEPKTG
jgi:hypothetical protein